MGARALVALLVAACLPAMASNADVPSAHFTDKDRVIFQEAVDGALAKGVDGTAIAWTNPETKARGQITPLKSFERGGKACRTLTIASHAKGRSATGPYTYCKAADGKWAVAKAEAKKK